MEWLHAIEIATIAVMVWRLWGLLGFGRSTGKSPDGGNVVLQPGKGAEPDGKDGLVVFRAADGRVLVVDFEEACIRSPSAAEGARIAPDD